MPSQADARQDRAVGAVIASAPSAAEIAASAMSGIWPRNSRCWIIEPSDSATSRPRNVSHRQRTTTRSRDSLEPLTRPLGAGLRRRRNRRPKVSQSALAGGSEHSGHLPGSKVRGKIAALRGLPEGAVGRRATGVPRSDDSGRFLSLRGSRSPADRRHPHWDEDVGPSRRGRHRLRPSSGSRLHHPRWPGRGKDHAVQVDHDSPSLQLPNRGISFHPSQFPQLVDVSGQDRRGEPAHEQTGRILPKLLPPVAHSCLTTGIRETSTSPSPPAGGCGRSGPRLRPVNR